MGDSRIVYGLALGKQGNWYTTWQNKTHGLLAQASTAPDVTTGCLFYSVNSSATTITNFGLRVAGSPDTGGNIAPLFEGKLVKIFFTDGSTTVASNARIYLANSASFAFPKNSWLGLIYHNSSWYETERSIDASGLRSIAVGATNEAITVTEADRVLTLAGTMNSNSIFLTGISGGYVGQRLLLIVGSGGCTPIITNTAGNIYCVGTDAFRIAGITSDANLCSVEVVKISNSYWQVMAPYKSIV